MVTDFKNLCTLRLGGAIARLVRSDQIDELLQAMRTGTQPLLMLGGGSNTVPSDAEFPGTVIQDARSRIQVKQGSVRLDLPDGTTDGTPQLEIDADQVLLRVDGGALWNDLVNYCIDNGFAGIEALAGIPGTVGAAPVQNIGAYGGEVASAIFGLSAYDRSEKRLCYLRRDQLRFSYRNSILKETRRDGEPSGRWLVLGVDLLLRRDTASNPIAYSQLAKALDVPLGSRVPIGEVRDSVVGLRRSKGMVLDDADHDTWSVGSFFTNPILPATAALPPQAPRFDAGSGLVKTSAAWLIEHAGIPKGFALPGSGAAVSTKHVLALTNHAAATGAEIRALAKHIQAAVVSAFGIDLIPEPVIL